MKTFLLEIFQQLLIFKIQKIGQLYNFRGINNVLKVLCDQYTMDQNIQYFTIEVNDINDEDLKKHFRVSNRFISKILEDGQKVLIHDEHGNSVAIAFLLAFMINNLQIPLKNSLDILRKKNIYPQLNKYFISQLEQYDIEKIKNFQQSAEEQLNQEVANE